MLQHSGIFRSSRHQDRHRATKQCPHQRQANVSCSSRVDKGFPFNIYENSP